MDTLKGPLLTVAEAAARTGWKECTILRREIAYVKLGRSVRIPESALNDLIELGFRPAITQAGRTD